MFFFYDIGTIINPAPMQDLNPKILETVHNTPEDIFPHTMNDPIDNKDMFTLHDLLHWFDSNQSNSYKQQYNKFCESQSYLCSTLQLQLDDSDIKKDYYALLSLLTINDMNNLVLSSHTLQTTLIIKNDPDQKKRWYATKQSIVININNLKDEEFFEVLVHELWHTLDLWVIQGNSTIVDTHYTEFWDPKFSEDDPSLEYYALSRESEGIKKRWSSITDFCSIYGSSNPFEDFAECFNLYINHHDYFVSLSQTNSTLLQKYHFIQSYIRQAPSYKSHTHNYNTDPSHRYRDSTKIPVSNIEITEA